jgi:hypothetical protein
VLSVPPGAANLGARPLVCGILADVARIRSLTAASVVLVVAALAGCAPGHAAAQDACQAYADTTRGSVVIKTFADAEAIRASAQSEAAHAASADARWQTLRKDIQDAYSHLNKMALNNGEADAYFAADRRVQADCKAAGADLGDLGH